MKIQTNNFKDTQKFGEEFSSQLKGGDVVLLFGNLGAGKTTFVQGLAKGLEITRRIISPTFIIVRRYEIPIHSSSSERSESRSSISSSRQARTINHFYHIDLYRIHSEDDLKGLGLPEILEEKNAIVVIEWPEKLGKFLPKKRYEIYFDTIDENKREITVEKLVG